MVSLFRKLQFLAILGSFSLASVHFFDQQCMSKFRLHVITVTRAAWEYSFHHVVKSRSVAHVIFVPYQCYHHSLDCNVIRVVLTHNCVMSPHLPKHHCSFSSLGPAASLQLDVRQPWFIGTILAAVGGALWFALCVFSVWLCRRRRNYRKQTHANGVVSGMLTFLAFTT